MTVVRQRGAAVVEFAIVSPILMLLALGAIEFGNLFLARAAASEAARASAITAVAAQPDPMVDRRIVESVARQLRISDDESQLLRVIVYRPNAEGEPDRRCFSVAARRRGGVDDECNIYQGRALRDVRRRTAVFGDCTNGLDRHWCPLERTHDPDDTVGIWIDARYRGVTGFFDWVDRNDFSVSTVASNSDEGYS